MQARQPELFITTQQFCHMMPRRLVNIPGKGKKWLTHAQTVLLLQLAIPEVIAAFKLSLACLDGHMSLNNGDMFREMRHQAISLLGKHHRVHLQTEMAEVNHCTWPLDAIKRCGDHKMEEAAASIMQQTASQQLHTQNSNKRHNVVNAKPVSQLVIIKYTHCM